MRWVQVSCAIALVLLATSCGLARGPLRLSGPAMGTTYHVVVTALPPTASRGDVCSGSAGICRSTGAPRGIHP